MESLATVFISVVTFLNSFAPQANIPQVLGVHIAQDTTSDVIDTLYPVKTLDRVRSDIEELEKAREERERIYEEISDRREKSREKTRVRKEEFREKLQLIRDERKKKIVENINSQLEGINDKWVNRFNKVLDRLTELLAKIESRADKASAGRDVTQVLSLISQAKDVIATAQDAVNAQAEKVYVIEIESESNLGLAVKNAIGELRSDLREVRSLVSEAKSAVTKALMSLKAIRGVDDDIVPTRTPKGEVENESEI